MLSLTSGLLLHEFISLHAVALSAKKFNFEHIF